MIWVTADLHGFPHDKFVNFLKASGFSDEDELYVLGDVIDRNGDGGVETLRWIMDQPNVHFLLGNHEDMLLKCSFLFEGTGRQGEGEGLDLDETMRFMNWLDNGADPTIQSLRKLMDDAPEELSRILRFLEAAPLYKSLTAGGKKYFLSHAGLGHYKKGKTEYDTDDLLWFRPELSTVYEGDETFVFGHTPVVIFGEEYEGRMLRTDTWFDIDTGAAYGRNPMLLRLDDEKEFYMEEKKE